MAKLIAPALLSMALIACAPGDGRELGGMDDSNSATPAARGAPSTQSPDAPVSNLDPVAPQPPATPTAECPVLGSRGWSAAVIGKPPGAGDRLRVEGVLVLSEGGYRARLEHGAVLEMHPPIQRLELAFERTGASGSREIAVRGEFPALSEYGAIDIRCGNRSLASITSVAWTENKIMEEDK
ncbi:MAG: hypothetical protein LC648_09975 [Novosphingobium sp.]|nr:hypothetical protein [Novosphingobium sp.]